MQTPIIIAQQIIIIALVLYIIWLKYERQFRTWWEARHRKPKQRRQLHPRSPYDCESCCVDHQLGSPSTRSDPPRWQDIKSQRGRPKTCNSEGYACTDPGCIYYHITDQRIHAL